MPLFGLFAGGAALAAIYRYFPLTAAFIFVLVFYTLSRSKRFLLLLFFVGGLLYSYQRGVPAEDNIVSPDRKIVVTGRFGPEEGRSDAGIGLRRFHVGEAADAETGDEIDRLEDGEVTVLGEISADSDEDYELILKTVRDNRRMTPGVSRNGPAAAGLVAAHPVGRGHSVAAFFDRMRTDINRRLMADLGNDRGALVAALTTGVTSYLGENMKESFSRAGLAHILSISGSHFGLLWLMIFGIIVFLIKRLPYSVLLRLSMYLTPRQAAAIVSLPFMVFYLGLSGGSVPAVRSFVMIMLFLTGLLLGRKGAWLNSLCFAAFLLVLWDPLVIIDLSFRLSFVAVICIGFVTDGGRDEDAGPDDGRFKSFAKKSLLISASAAAGTAPLVAYHFHYVSLISVFSNLLIAPFIGFLLIPAALVSSVIFILTGMYPFEGIMDFLADISIRMVTASASVPYAAVDVQAFPAVLCLLFYASFIPYFIYGSRRELLLLPVIPFVLYAVLRYSSEDGLGVAFLDVGQGDSSVVETATGRTFVIDTGRTGKETSEYLKYRAKRTIDALVLTHNHPDHSGGLEYLLERFDVREIWDNGRLIYPGRFSERIRIRPFMRGDTVTDGETEITAIHPYSEYYSAEQDGYDDENGPSLVLRVAGKRSSFMFAGDIDEEAEWDISHLGPRLKSDVLKVPHHGSSRSADEEFLSKVGPSLAVISVGRQNSFGHPGAEMLEGLAAARVLRTDTDGSVRLIETPRGLEVRTFREWVLEPADGLRKEYKNYRRIFGVW